MQHSNSKPLKTIKYNLALKYMTPVLHVTCTRELYLKWKKKMKIDEDENRPSDYVFLNSTLLSFHHFSPVLLLQNLMKLVQVTPWMEPRIKNTPTFHGQLGMVHCHTTTAILNHPRCLKWTLLTHLPFPKASKISSHSLNRLIRRLWPRWFSSSLRWSTMK